jgi:parvulin-like peptidyl-prolyl isomerase
LHAIPDDIGADAWRQRAAQVVAPHMRRQVTEALVLAEAQREMPDALKQRIDADIEAMLRERIAEAGGSRAALEAQLRAEGTTLEEFLTVQRRERVSSMYLRQKFVPQLSTTRDQLYRYYQANLDEFSTAPSVQMQILAVPYAEFYPDSGRPSAAEIRAAQTRARQRAAEALQRIRAGEDFGQVVQDVGVGYRAEDGGVLDPMPLGSLRESAVEEAAMAQEVGQVSDVIEGETGCFVVKTLQVDRGEVTPFEQAQSEIDETLRDRQYQRLMTEYLDRLYGQAVRTEAERFEQVLMDRAMTLYYRPPGP